MSTERTWVRDHRHSGYVAGRFQGEFDGQPREMLVVQTLSEIVLIPSGSELPIDKEYILRQAVHDLEPIVQALIDGGLSSEEVVRVWEQALAYQKKIAAHPEQ